MTTADDLPDRVTRVEREVTQARRDELRAHTKSLEALRETQLDQGREMREGFGRLEGEMREGFAKMGVGMAQITALLKNAEDESDGC